MIISLIKYFDPILPTMELKVIDVGPMCLFSSFEPSMPNLLTSLHSYNLSDIFGSFVIISPNGLS